MLIVNCIITHPIHYYSRGDNKLDIKPKTESRTKNMFEIKRVPESQNHNIGYIESHWNKVLLNVCHPIALTKIRHKPGCHVPSILGEWLTIFKLVSTPRKHINLASPKKAPIHAKLWFLCTFFWLTEGASPLSLSVMLLTLTNVMSRNLEVWGDRFYSNWLTTQKVSVQTGGSGNQTSPFPTLFPSFDSH